MSNCIVCGTSTVCGTGTHKKKSRKYCSNDCIKKACYLRNKAKYTEATKNWINTYPEKRRQHSEKYRRLNKHYYAQYRSAYRYRLKQATPLWSSIEDIISVYQEAEYFQLEVDHIIPLKHPLVCGLHVWENLQLLSRSANAHKSNKFDIDILAKVEE